MASTLVLARPAAQERLTFIGVALDKETRQADSKLTDYLSQRTGVKFAPDMLEYERVVDRLVRWRASDGAFIARTTPYVYVAAEMLGAPLEVLATYTSAATSSATYHAYFVVRRKDFPAGPPGLLELERYLSQRETPARFVYHNAFSSSSYFLPSLYFRARRIFDMSEHTESLVAIQSAQSKDGSSSGLLQLVAQGDADLAAVWDGTKSRYTGNELHFVQLPTRLPNDLLVCSTSLDRATKDRLRAAIAAMGPKEIGVADFESWKAIDQAPDARHALAELRWLARDRPAPVTVQIQPADGVTADMTGLLEATRQAVRLSGTELVVYDEDFHSQQNYVWRLQPIHDGAVILQSSLPGSDLEDQKFQFSFGEPEDLTKRIVAVIAERLHRVRYVWPYSSNRPIVIRDIVGALRAGVIAKVQRVTWLDPERNQFIAGPVFDARVAEPSFYRLELEATDFNSAGQTPSAYGAMSNIAYRVILVRDAEQRALFRVLVIALLVLAVLAAMGAAWDLRRAFAAPRVAAGG